MKSYKILNIRGITDNRYGNCLLVEAAPIKTNASSESFSFSNIENFVYPEEQSFINRLTHIANGGGFLEVDYEDFRSETINMSGERKLCYRHKSFFSSENKIKSISTGYTDERKVGIISYNDGSVYYGSIKNGKRDGYGFMIEESNHSIALAKYRNDAFAEVYSDLLQEMLNNTVGFVGNTFYKPNGVFIGDIICPDLSDSMNDEVRKRQLGLSGRDRYGIAILDNGCMYVGSFKTGSSMKLVEGYKLDENGMEHRGVFTLPIERDGGEYPW